MYSSGSSSHSEPASGVRRRAALAREREAREIDAAELQERLAKVTGVALHVRLAGVHRRSAACHRTAAELHEDYARLLASWEGGCGAPPRFMTGVAAACGTRSAAVTFTGSDHSQLAVAASNDQARAAQELEFVLGEGPTRDAMVRHRTVRASGARLRDRWPGYGPEAEELGIKEVVAVPLTLRDSCLGSLTVFDPGPGLTTVFTDIAEALTRTMVSGPQADPEFYGGVDHRAVVHQAAGMVSVQAACPVADALELIKARAFSEGEPVQDVAARIVRGDVRLG
ncbi:GAF and ANTAR domain-containing protein [Streptomyces sp. SAS_270]|uniref:GAF and ANTAR domain-containing protein n=1 Tax=Streptomyces sp. SAS_270 TaxID=3412748 RepID=UPI00403D1242